MFLGNTGSRVGYDALAVVGERGTVAGEYRTTTHLRVNWKDNSWFRRIQNLDLYGKLGVTFSRRTTSNFSARLLNPGVFFRRSRPGSCPKNVADAPFLLAFMNSFVVTYLMEVMVGGGDSSVPRKCSTNLAATHLEHLVSVDVTDDDRRFVGYNVDRLVGLLDLMDDDESIRSSRAFFWIGP